MTAITNSSAASRSSARSGTSSNRAAAKELNNENKPHEEMIHGKLLLRIIFASGLRSISKSSSSYCRIILPNSKILNTKEMKEASSPEWNESFEEELSMKKRLADVIDFEVFDKQEIGSECIGMVRIPMDQLLKFPGKK